MLFLVKHIRKIVYALALFWAAGVYIGISNTISEAAVLSEVIRWYGLTSLYLLFAALTPGLMQVFLPGFRWNAPAIVARRAIGVSAFFFGFLHGLIVFGYGFGWQWNFLLLVEGQHRIALSFSLIALFILAAMALTSFDRAVQWLTYKRWKFLHRFVYLAVALLVFHTFLIGSDFQDQLNWPSLVLKIVALVYVILEVAATAKKLDQTKANRPSFQHNVYIFGLCLIVIAAIYTAGYVHFAR